MEKDRLIDFYYRMLLIRRFEERSSQSYMEGKIGGFLHLYIGQEAVAVGAISAARNDDYIITSYREHGHALARGCDPKKVMAELFGKSGGLCKGKGGSMHLFDRERNFLGGYAIVAGHLPLAAGVGYAINYTKSDKIVLCFFGEGAVNIGAFHESFNVASLWRLPVIFICENNRYGMGTPVERASAIYDIFRRGCSYDMHREQVDGMDILAVYETVKKSADEVRELKMPHFIEATTYRFRGHSMADPAHYRTDEELEEQKKRDPLVTFPAQLKKEGILTEEDIKRMEKEIEDIIESAVLYADSSPPPSPDELTKDVYI